MIERREVQRPLLDRLLVVDAEVVLERDDLLARGRTRAAVAAPPSAFRTAEYTK